MSPRVHDGRKLMPCSYRADPDDYFIRLLFIILLDFYWTTSLTTSAFFASSKGYVVSYSQVW